MDRAAKDLGVRERTSARKVRENLCLWLVSGAVRDEK